MADNENDLQSGMMVPPDSIFANFKPYEPPPELAEELRILEVKSDFRNALRDFRSSDAVIDPANFVRQAKKLANSAQNMENEDISTTEYGIESVILVGRQYETMVTLASPNLNIDMLTRDQYVQFLEARHGLKAVGISLNELGFPDDALERLDAISQKRFDDFPVEEAASDVNIVPDTASASVIVVDSDITLIPSALAHDIYHQIQNVMETNENGFFIDENGREYGLARAANRLNHLNEQAIEIGGENYLAETFPDVAQYFDSTIEMSADIAQLRGQALSVLDPGILEYSPEQLKTFRDAMTGLNSYGITDLGGIREGTPGFERFQEISIQAGLTSTSPYAGVDAAGTGNLGLLKEVEQSGIGLGDNITELWQNLKQAIQYAIFSPEVGPT